jgi:hypothetical protein
LGEKSRGGLAQAPFFTNDENHRGSHHDQRQGEIKQENPESHQLMRYDAMCTAIDRAYEVDEVKDIHDKAVALEAYFRQAKNPEPERRACEIRLRAERKAGLLVPSRADKASATPWRAGWRGQ